MFEWERCLPVTPFGREMFAENKPRKGENTLPDTVDIQGAFLRGGWWQWFGDQLQLLKVADDDNVDDEWWWWWLGVIMILSDNDDE